METTAINQAAQNLAAQQPAQAGDMLFGLTFWGIMASLLFGGIGFVYLKYGKTTGNVPMMVCGVGMMVYPYFFSSTLFIVLIGIGLAALPSILERL